MRRNNMSPEITVGLLSLAGTLIGSLAGIMAANKLTVYRIEQLEKKVDKHNTVVERVALLENDNKMECNRIDELRKMLEEIKKEVYKEA
jgi:hypothetical protein